MGEGNGIAGALNLAKRAADRAEKSGKLPPWAAHLINTLTTIVTLFFGSQFMPSSTAPAPLSVAEPAVNPDGTMTVTPEQRAAWRVVWQQHGRQQVLHDIAVSVREDHSPDALLHLILGLAAEATAPLPSVPGEVTP